MNERIVVWNVVGIVLIVWALAIEVLFINAWMKQPRRPKARVGTVVTTVVLLADIGCFYGNAAPGGIIPTVLVTISAYRTYRRWHPKFWDPSHPQFAGWPR